NGPLCGETTPRKAAEFANARFCATNDFDAKKNEMQIPAAAGETRYAPFVPQGKRNDSDGVYRRAAGGKDLSSHSVFHALFATAVFCYLVLMMAPKTLELALLTAAVLG